jgi:tetratricopeptide (TPR) repeat protein
MNRKVVNLILGSFCILLSIDPILAQAKVEGKIGISIFKFEPSSSSSANNLFEESLTSIIALGLINQEFDIMINKKLTDPRDEKLAIQKGLTNMDLPLRLLNELSEKNYDYIIYGEYSFNKEEVFISPKLYDIKNEKNYILQSLRIADFKRNFKLSNFENLVNNYREKIGFLAKTKLNLFKVGLLWSSKEGYTSTSFEKNLYRSYIIETTKSADTIKLVDVLDWNSMESYYSGLQNYSDISNILNLDLIYSILFYKVTNYEVKADIAVYNHKLDYTFQIPGFVFDIIKFPKVEVYLTSDFYNLLKDVRTTEGFDFHLLEMPATDIEDLEEYATVLSNKNKFLLSNLMFNLALESFPNSINKYYYYYAIGYNFVKLNQFDRAIYYLDKSLSLNVKSLYNDTIYANVLYEKGLCLFNLDDFQKALDIFLKIEDSYPKFIIADVQFMIGLCYYYTKKDKESLAYFQKSADNGYSDLDDVYYNMILVYNHSENYDNAIEYFSHKFDSNPGDLSARKYLAYSFYKAADRAFGNQKYEQARRYLEKNENIFQDDQSVDSAISYKFIKEYNNIRRLTYLYLCDYDKAFIITQTGLENGEFDKSYIYLDNALELDYVKSPGNDKRRYEEIIKYYQLHFETNPNDSLKDEVLNSIGFYYSKLGDQDNCLKYTEKALKINPDELSYYLNKMEVSLVMKNYKEVNITSNTVLNSKTLKTQLDSLNKYETIFYFLLVNADIAQGKEINDHMKYYEKNIAKNEFSISWDFTLYDKWFNEFTNEKKAILSKMYKNLKSHNISQR